MNFLNPELEGKTLSRKEELVEKRNQLVENRLANQSDPAFASEIQEEIDEIDRLLQELDN